jgi:diacylglycerol O-acyltransferase
MAGRQLSGLDIAFLCLEGKTTPMHMGAVVIFQPSAAVNPEKISTLLAERAARVPRLRSRVGTTLFGGATWLEDTEFDARQHVHHHRLGEFCEEEDPLTAYAAEWIEEPLDLRRPPWSLQVVTGLPGERFALLLKLHHSFTDGAGAFAVAAGLLDELPVTRSILEATESAPDGRSPLTMLKDGVTAAFTDLGANAGIASAVLRAARPYPLSPLSAPNSPSRRLAFVRLDLADVRKIRTAHGGTSNDVILAVLTGGLREWMVNRGQRVEGRSLRALIPVSTRARDTGPAANRLSGYLCELPVHLEDPVHRLSAIHRSMHRNKAAGPLAGPGAVPILAERIPPPLHRLATGMVGQAAGLLFDTVITNVPLPKFDLSLDGAPLREVYPLVPLAPRSALGIAAAVYRDGVHIGLQVNGDAVTDTGSLRDAVLKASAALYERSVSP